MTVKRAGSKTRSPKDPRPTGTLPALQNEAGQQANNARTGTVQGQPRTRFGVNPHAGIPSKPFVGEEDPLVRGNDNSENL